MQNNIKELSAVEVANVSGGMFVQPDVECQITLEGVVCDPVPQPPTLPGFPIIVN